MQVLWGIGGMAALLAIAFALSTNRWAINPRTVVGALAIQATFAFVVLYSDIGSRALELLTNGVQAIIDSSNGGMAPTRRGQIAKFGIRAVIAGTLANLMSAAIAGMLVG